MRNFDWIFNEEGKVAEGKECVYDEPDNDWNWYDNKPVVVTLAGYRPYYTDETPDPKNDEVNEWCYIETNEDVRGEKQLELCYLFKIEDAEEKEALYNGSLYDVRGKYTNHFDDEMYILIKEDNEYLIVEKTDIEEYSSPYDLNEEDTKTLFNEIGRGSIYLSDYANSVGCTWDEASSFCEGYYEWLYEEYGEDCHELDNLDSWLSYAGF